MPSIALLTIGTPVKILGTDLIGSVKGFELIENKTAITYLVQFTNRAGETTERYFAVDQIEEIA